MKIDLNCDLGEDFGRWRIPLDHEIMSQITSANIACGFHAGDPGIMRMTVRRALSSGVHVGAHPGHPDLAGFGRRVLEVSPEEARDYVVYQVGALMAFARAEGGRVMHVKPHGALYNQAAKDKGLANAIAKAVAEIDRELILVAPSNSEMYRAGIEAGLKTASEVFADRAYSPDGTLVPRSRPGAVILDRDKAVRQAIQMVIDGTVTATDGTVVTVTAHTLCIHGDGPDPLSYAREIRAALERVGVEVAPMGEWLGSV
ncbi:MAG: LamB/YcsF family protein [Firmicutes bacterium]|nr:LamB/YcsF family protein [Bacillota bacterium]